MRLTSALLRGKRTYRDKLEYLRKRLWRNRDSLMKVDRLRVPEKLLQHPKNPLANAEDMYHSTRYEEALAEEIEMGIHPSDAEKIRLEREHRFTPWMAHAGDPRHRPSVEHQLMYSDKRRFTKGLDQASLLTNCVILHGQPDSLSQLTSHLDGIMRDPETQTTTTDSPPASSTSSSLSLSNWQSELRTSVEQAVLHAHVWHTDEVKLPRRFRSDLPIWKHKAEYGIHPEQATRYLFHNLFRILQLQTPFLQGQLNRLPNPTSPTDLPSRWITRDRLLETHYQWGPESRRIGFRCHHDLVISGTQELAPFASIEEAEHVVSKPRAPIANLGPMSPLIDLQSTDYYLDRSTDGWADDHQSRVFPHPHLITINLSLPNQWSDFLEPEATPISVEQRQAAALMHCFASTLATAHSHGWSATSGPLPQPICVHGVCSDGVNFDFIHFQLNTLDFGDVRKTASSAARNLAWVDGPHRLVDKQIPKRSMLRNTVYRDLDLSVLSRLATSFFWGLQNAAKKTSLEVGKEAHRRATVVAS